MHRALIAVWAVGVPAIILSIVYLVKSAPEGQFKGLECPKCAKLVSPLGNVTVRHCPRCKGENIRMVPKYVSEHSLFARITGPVLFEVNLLFGVYLLLFQLAQRKKHRVDEREFRRFNCPKCGQKLRYHKRRAGAAGQCPRCNDLFAFPEEGEENAAYSHKQDDDDEA